MKERLIWECQGANKAVLASRVTNIVSNGICAAVGVIALMADARMDILQRLAYGDFPFLFLGIVLLVVGVCGIAYNALMYSTAKKSYLRLFESHVELLSTSFDALLKASWQGVKVSAPKEQILGISVAGKKLVVNAQTGTYEVFVPSVEEAEANMRKYIER